LEQRGYLTDLSEERERGLMVKMATLLHEADLASSPPSFVFVPAYTCNLRCPSTAFSRTRCTPARVRMPQS
jgi:uncharacterized protein